MLFSGKNIIVTGATGDLGVAIVQRLISEGANVLAIAGHQSALSRLATFSGPGTLETSVADVSDTEPVLGYPPPPAPYSSGRRSLLCDSDRRSDRARYGFLQDARRPRAHHAYGAARRKQQRREYSPSSIGRRQRRAHRASVQSWGPGDRHWRSGVPQKTDLSAALLHEREAQSG